MLHSFCYGYPSLLGGFPSQRTCKAISVSMAWHIMHLSCVSSVNMSTHSSWIFYRFICYIMMENGILWARWLVMNSGRSRLHLLVIFVSWYQPTSLDNHANYCGCLVGDDIYLIADGMYGKYVLYAQSYSTYGWVSVKLLTHWSCRIFALPIVIYDIMRLITQLYCRQHYKDQAILWPYTELRKDAIYPLGHRQSIRNYVWIYISQLTTIWPGL